MKWYDVEKKIKEKNVREIASSFNITLPEDYVEKIGKTNGGSLSGAFIIHPVLGEIPYSKNIPLDKKSDNNIYTIFKDLRKKQKGLFPFADDDFGDYYCFDLETGKVVLWLHETNTIEYVCGSFTELMSLIKFNQ